MVALHGVVEELGLGRDRHSQRKAPTPSPLLSSRRLGDCRGVNERHNERHLWNVCAQLSSQGCISSNDLQRGRNISPAPGLILPGTLWNKPGNVFGRVVLSLGACIHNEPHLWIHYAHICHIALQSQYHTPQKHKMVWAGRDLRVHLVPNPHEQHEGNLSFACPLIPFAFVVEDIV